MGFDWYLAFLLGVVLLRCGATPRDRNALTIVLAATVTSWMIVHFITQGITGSWKLVIPGSLETATVWALLKWARNRSGLMQAGLVAVAWYAHLLCYLDIEMGTNMIYDNYAATMAVVAALQLAACYDTYLHHFRRFANWAAVGTGRAVPVRGAGVPVAILHDPRRSGHQET